ncbi:hypothetical protein JJB52_14985 [Clostridium perfringens]|uniref:Uncharacterized protein n=1 Tax=Clostridium perfringens TaxID=1502 RepID=A0AAP4A9W2_CLOPF|nr:hypothetical protein [Clostridium perfringens]EHK2357490.1 hypothetical protein [Clostridium perfringens]MBO3345142.1 hypothetical protein [Clostridium perfringens]MBO3348231.1 hypothetical protein [Clostridium perfringens]MBO3351284.1 hypothetical protein [Clostridium perfringens]MBO3353717.1 hypothetical protein [Clostridium perfringens]
MAREVLEQLDKKNQLLLFLSLDYDGYFINNIVDESVYVEKIVETQIMIESVRVAIYITLILMIYNHLRYTLK